jgi:peptidoglycan hydrolase-like protein with peptidoglycan-binding domain
MWSRKEEIMRVTVLCMLAIAILFAATAHSGEQSKEVRLIRKVQETLTEIGYDPGPVDGLLGPKTRAAISEFQRIAGLPVTGEDSEVLRAHLCVFTFPVVRKAGVTGYEFLHSNDTIEVAIPEGTPEASVPSILSMVARGFDDGPSYELIMVERGFMIKEEGEGIILRGIF